MSKVIKFEVPTTKQSVWKVTSRIMKLFYKKPTIINLQEELPSKVIYVANHSAMNGVVNYSLHFPDFVAIWGAHQMLGSYKMRYCYYRNVFCIQKKGMNKFVATLLALPVALFNKMFYRGMKVLPTYQDGRLKSTLQHTVNCLDKDVSVMIFPENSNDGYHDVLTEFFHGFVLAVKRYNKLRNYDLSICPVYYDNVTKTLVIGRCSTLCDKQDWSNEQIAEHYRNQVNDLFFQHVQPLRQQKLAKKQRENQEQCRKNAVTVSKNYDNN